MTIQTPPESGDRSAFLDRLRERAAGGDDHRAGSAHPQPAPQASAPTIGFRRVEPGPEQGPVDLADVFAAVAGDQDAIVHRTAGTQLPLDVLRTIVTDHHITTAVVSAEPMARAHAGALRELGVDVSTTTDPAEVGVADLGVTSAVAAIAATGSVVTDCSVAGSRTVSLLPRVHLCVVPADAVVATPADVLRGLGGDARALPSNLVLISGPSRTGDIEQLLTLGVHGPIAIHVALTGLEPGPPDEPHAGEPRAGMQRGSG